MIYHVTTTLKWEDALSAGQYVADSLSTEGFIHCSSKEQVAGVLKRYYANEKNLVLLHIEENKLTPELKYELAPSVNEMFPHIFGPINLDAIVLTENLDS